MYYRRPLFWVLVIVVCIFTLSTLSHLNNGPSPLSLTSWNSQSKAPAAYPLPIRPGPPTTRFKDALLPDHKYIFTFPNAGWTNDVMNVATLLLLGILTRRTPILSPFHPSHIGKDASLIPFSKIFDIERLSAELHMPLVEFEDIKNTSDYQHDLDPVTRGYYGGETESMGCWTLWPTQAANGAGARSLAQDSLSLDLSFTPIPFGHEIEKPYLHWNLHYLAELAFPAGRKDGIKQAQSFNENLAKIMSSKPNNKDAIPEPRKIPFPNKKGEQIDPDEQVACFDFVYFTGMYKGGTEWWDESSPIWHLVGRHMHWAPLIKSLAIEYVSDRLGIPANKRDGTMPPFIAVHARRADFARVCPPRPREECLAPLSAYTRRVEETRQALAAKGFQNTGPEDLKVIMLSDEPKVTPTMETDRLLAPLYAPGSAEAWWKSVADQGWFWIDHEELNSVSKHGKWYTMLIDACIQSAGIGFVGTDRSTMSSIALRRTEEWNNGVGSLVRWGRPDSDAH
ncbi:hypothetical protein SISSUDRAFT_1021527 [Sistotremastrum suecicum HHB10207 ss-3]|uniref:Uncharacterized protein n=1 Tax=Sistotremastrum suecicum HHB10207 ss-3 TaxID=1314776 RepID=A0A166DDW5_9AGAM|nr:hypothetical protein SISSUDRAFT_1021527 [Sistotremastrum suecicum HHB10207 ss-3]